MIWTVALPKGGSTKTTTAAELVYALAQRGRRVLAVDLDQQGHLARRLGLRADTPVEGVTADVLSGRALLAEAATSSPVVDGVSVLAGTHELVDLERKDVERAFRSRLATTAWDDLVLDCPPALGPITRAALRAADKTVAPVACEVECELQLVLLADVLALVSPGRTLDAVVPTKHSSRRTLDRSVVERLNAAHPGRVTHPIRESVIARAAFDRHLPVSAHAPKHNIANDYAAAMTQILDGRVVDIRTEAVAAAR